MGWLSPLPPGLYHGVKHKGQFLFASHVPVLLGRLDPEEGVTKILRNVGKYSPTELAPVPACDFTSNLQLEQISASDESVRSS